MTYLSGITYLNSLKQAWVIVAISILSISTWGNYFGRPEHWNSQISPGEKPSQPVTTRKTKNKTLQHSWKHAATPNYKMRQRTSSLHNTALEGRRPADSIYRRLKFLIKVLCTLNHNSSTRITQPATVILHVPKSCCTTTLHCWNLYSWSPEQCTEALILKTKEKQGWYIMIPTYTGLMMHRMPLHLRGPRNCSRFSSQKCQHSGDLAQSEILRPQEVLFAVQEYKKPQEKHSCAQNCISLQFIRR